MTKSFEFRCVTSPFPDNKVSDRLIFASYQIYNNSDFNLILDEIELYKDSGLDILYDDDFNPRMEWSNSIFYAISNCSVFVVFITPNCQKSQDFKAGIKLARTENIPIVVVYLSDTTLTGKFESDLKDYPTIHKNKLSNSEYIEECRNAFTNVKSSSSAKDPISFKKFDRLIHRGKTNIELESDVILDSGESADFEDGIKLDVRGLIVEGNGFSVDAKNQARVFELTGGDITFRNVTFKNAVARLGAVAHAKRGSSCTFEDCTFEDNHSRADGGCFNNYGDLIFRNCTFKNNYSDEHGGAIINWGDIILEDCEFKNNSSKNFNGGAISNEESHNIKIVNTKFIDNSAKNGGAILNEGCTYVKNCEFRNNSSVEDGDSIHIKNGTATVKNSSFADSKSREIYEASGYHIDFTDCTFSGTRTSSGSSSGSSSSKSNFDALESLIRNAGSTLTLDRDFRVDSSETSRFEEGIEFDGVDITIDGAGHSIDGGDQVRIFKMVNSGTVRLKNITFKNGRSNLGAGVRCDSGTKVYIDDCLFEDNHSTGDGGGLRNNGPVVVRNTIFRNNVADKYGGAILNYDDLEIEDCTFENNRTGEFDGGAIYSDDKLRIRNSAFKNNTAENRGHDLCSVRSGTLEVRNSRFDKSQSSAISSDNSPDIYGCDFSGSASSSGSSSSGNDFEYLSDLIHGSSKRISLNSDIVLGSNESSEFEDGIKFDVDNVTIDANGHTIDARDSVRAFKLTASDVTIRNARFINGESRLGAVCHASKGSSCTFEDCIFEDNHSRADGGTFNNYGDLIFRNCTFRNNVSDEHGGAIINWGDIILEDCEFKNNSSKNFNGGAISNESSHNIKIVNTHFEDNRAKNGGAILNEGCCYVRDSTFKDNSCVEDGDGIHIKNGTATVKNSKFSGSKSREIYEVSGHSIDFTNCDFSSSSSGGSRSRSGGRKNFEYLDNLIHGGSKRITLEDDIALDSSEASQFEKGIKLDVNNLVLDGNGHTIDAKGKVRIFDVSAGNVTLKNFNFKNGYSKLGGVIETDRHVHIKISHCTFEGNEAFGDGGAIRNWHEGDVKINDCTFRKNSSSDHGGAIFNYGNLEVADSRFESNTAKNHNGGAIATDNKLLVKNCVFIDNTAPHRNGDSIYNDGSEMFEAQNCKFSGNKNSEVGSSNSSKMKLKNCKFNDDGDDDNGKSGGGVVSKIFGRFRS